MLHISVNMLYVLLIKSVWEVVVVPYVVRAVVAVTVMHVLLFVLHVCVLCEGDGSAGVVAVSVCMSGTRGSGVLSSTCDVLVRGVCVWLGAVWVEMGVSG